MRRASAYHPSEIFFFFFPVSGGENGRGKNMKNSAIYPFFLLLFSAGCGIFTAEIFQLFIKDENDEVTLYNPSEHEITLDGLYISDESSNKFFVKEII